MKHFKGHHFAIIPLLSILAMSPSVMETEFSGRHIASIQEEVKGHPKYESLVSKVDPKSIMKDLDINAEKFKAKRDELSVKLKKEREEFKKDQSDKVVVDEQRKKVEALVVDVLLVEGSLKDLQEKKGIEQADDEASQKLITESKDIIEGMISDLLANEVLVAKASEPKAEEPKKEEEKPVVADNEEPKKEEVKQEEPKKEEEVKPVVADKEEPKKEEVKKEEEKKEEVCEAEAKNKVLTAQIEQLMSQQQNIMQTLLGMAQMMVSMHQNQQPNPYYSNGAGFQVQTPYQYQQPMTAGNWVYYPQGFQPSQPNIFAQPQVSQYQPQQQYGIYPDQMHQQQSNWSLQPTMSFGDQRFNTQPMMPGPFGDQNFTFNMQPSTPAPQMPIISQR